MNSSVCESFIIVMSSFRVNTTDISCAKSPPMGRTNSCAESPSMGRTNSCTESSANDAEDFICFLDKNLLCKKLSGLSIEQLYEILNLIYGSLPLANRSLLHEQVIKHIESLIPVFSRSNKSYPDHSTEELDPDFYSSIYKILEFGVLHKDIIQQFFDKNKDVKTKLATKAGASAVADTTSYEAASGATITSTGIAETSTSANTSTGTAETDKCASAVADTTEVGINLDNPAHKTEASIFINFTIHAIGMYVRMLINLLLDSEKVPLNSSEKAPLDSSEKEQLDSSEKKPLSNKEEAKNLYDKFLDRITELGSNLEKIQELALLISLDYNAFCEKFEEYRTTMSSGGNLAIIVVDGKVIFLDHESLIGLIKSISTHKNPKEAFHLPEMLTHARVTIGGNTVILVYSQMLDEFVQNHNTPPPEAKATKVLSGGKKANQEKAEDALKVIHAAKEAAAKDTKKPNPSSKKETPADLIAFAKMVKDGNFLCTWSFDILSLLVRKWAIKESKHVCTLLYCTTLSNPGKIDGEVKSREYDGVVILWNFETGELHYVLYESKTQSAGVGPSQMLGLVLNFFNKKASLTNPDNFDTRLPTFDLSIYAKCINTPLVVKYDKYISKILIPASVVSEGVIYYFTKGPLAGVNIYGSTSVNTIILTIFQNIISTRYPGVTTPFNKDNTNIRLTIGDDLEVSSMSVKITGECAKVLIDSITDMIGRLKEFCLRKDGMDLYIKQSFIVWLRDTFLSYWDEGTNEFFINTEFKTWEMKLAFSLVSVLSKSFANVVADAKKKQKAQLIKAKSSNGPKAKKTDAEIAEITRKGQEKSKDNLEKTTTRAEELLKLAATGGSNPVIGAPIDDPPSNPHGVIPKPDFVDFINYALECGLLEIDSAGTVQNPFKRFMEAFYQHSDAALEKKPKGERCTKPAAPQLPKNEFIKHVLSNNDVDYCPGGGTSILYGVPNMEYENVHMEDEDVLVKDEGVRVKDEGVCGGLKTAENVRMSDFPDDSAKHYENGIERANRNGAAPFTPNRFMEGEIKNLAELIIDIHTNPENPYKNCSALVSGIQGFGKTTFVHNLIDQLIKIVSQKLKSLSSLSPEDEKLISVLKSLTILHASADFSQVYKEFNKEILNGVHGFIKDLYDNLPLGAILIIDNMNNSSFDLEKYAKERGAIVIDLMRGYSLWEANVDNSFKVVEYSYEVVSRRPQASEVPQVPENMKDKIILGHNGLPIGIQVSPSDPNAENAIREARQYVGVPGPMDLDVIGLSAKRALSPNYKGWRQDLFKHLMQELTIEGVMGGVYFVPPSPPSADKKGKRGGKK